MADATTENVEFNHFRGGTVRLKMGGRKGFVVGLMVDRDDVQWASVEYADANGAVFERWFREGDLERLSS